METRVKRFFQSKPDHPNMKYGRFKEDAARKKYEDVQGVQAFKCGLIVSKTYKWLCGSPDAISIDQEGNRILLEIKCPASNRNSEIKVKYLKDGKLKESSEYFTQVQILMYLTKCQLAHLFIYSDADYKLVEVEFDKKYL